MPAVSEQRERTNMNPMLPLKGLAVVILTMRITDSEGDQVETKTWCCGESVASAVERWKLNYPVLATNLVYQEIATPKDGVFRF